MLLTQLRLRLRLRQLRGGRRGIGIGTGTGTGRKRRSATEFGDGGHRAPLLLLLPQFLALPRQGVVRDGGGRGLRDGIPGYRGEHGDGRTEPLRRLLRYRSRLHGEADDGGNLYRRKSRKSRKMGMRTGEAHGLVLHREPLQQGGGHCDGSGDRHGRKLSVVSDDGGDDQQPRLRRQQEDRRHRALAWDAYGAIRLQGSIHLFHRHTKKSPYSHHTRRFLPFLVVNIAPHLAHPHGTAFLHCCPS